MEAALRALSEPNRMHIVELLRDGPLPVGEIVETLHLHQPQVSKHLKVLNEAGLVEMIRQAQKHVYKLRAEPLQEMDAWLDSYRKLWNERLDRLDKYLTDVQKKERNHSKGKNNGKRKKK